MFEVRNGLKYIILLYIAVAFIIYYLKPDITKREFFAQIGVDPDTNQEVETDGYLRTGDLGFLHKEELFICGRLKDLIIIGGRNYYPQDLEATAEAIDDRFRPGCSAAFTIDPISGEDEQVAIVLELREVPPSEVRPLIIKHCFYIDYRLYILMTW